MKVLVIGGVAAGTKAAAKLKREDRGLDVALITKDQDISYAGCGLPYYVGGMIESRDELIVNTPEKYAALTGVRVLTGREAVELDSGKKLVTAKNLITGETEAYSYDRLVIATGASSAVPPIEGVGLKGVFKMRTPDDAIRIRDYVEAERVKKAVVIGGGFIGLEVAENLLAQGVDVTVMDFASQIMPNVLDPEMADYAQRHLRKQGVRVLTGTKAEKLVGDVRVTAVKTASATLPAELVVLSAGIRPNTAFLASSGIEMEKGAFVVDSQLKTNLPGVYAAGDCALVTNRITGRRQWSPMGSSANLEGRTLAQVLAGKEKTYPGVLGTGVVKLPGLNCGRTGLTEAQAKEAGVYQAFVMDEVFDKMETGEAAISAYYAGDYLTMLETNPDLKYVVPEEGSNWFVDAMCVLKDAENKDEAEEWINFLCSTDASLKNMDYIWYASPNGEALEEYPAYYEEVNEEPLDPEIYEVMAPSEEVLHRCEIYENLPTETLRLYDRLWTRLGV